MQGFPDGWTQIGSPEEVEVKDYEYEYDDEGDVIWKTLAGTHTELGYFYVGSNGKKKRCADTARYKALGNSIAVGFANNRSGFWCWLMRRISAQYEHRPTQGSLFSGIGGFDLAWAAVNGPESVRWSSEIEEFPISVLKQHFGDEDAGIAGDFYEAIGNG